MQHLGGRGRGSLSWFSLVSEKQAVDVDETGIEALLDTQTEKGFFADEFSQDTSQMSSLWGKKGPVATLSNIFSSTGSISRSDY